MPLEVLNFLRAGRRRPAQSKSDSIERLRASGLFDEEFYCRANPDVVNAGVDPIGHYLSFGAGERRDPHPLFSTSWYLDIYPDVAAAGVNPLLHYLEHGSAEGRSPHPDFDGGWYLSAFPEAAGRAENALVHFITNAERETPLPSVASRSGRPSRATPLDPVTADCRYQIEQMERVRGLIQGGSERTDAEAREKLNALGNMLPVAHVGRAAIFREMTRLARRGGADLIAATYSLRLMRWLGGDRYGDLPFVTEALNAGGLPAVAEAANAMFGDPATADAKCRAILDQQAAVHLTKPDLPLARREDTRGGSEPKVSIIVSLYRAEDKLGRFLNDIAAQTLVRQGQAELVLVDSNSPTDEYAVFRDFLARHPVPAVYARSAQRETIQAAWNRGIKLARAPYLCFLGADEGLFPDALATLAAALDTHPDVDWAMSNSIMTDVDMTGGHVSDGWYLNRAAMTRDLIRLDPTYLTFVGGLHRKSIHSRFGYFDESFGAAGDTEFKSRVLARIKTLHVPKTLGVYFNFPDERMTERPVAELEDLRALHIFRTRAGMAYEYEAAPDQDSKALFRLSLGYRKSYRTTIGTDFDMAAVAAGDLLSRDPASLFAQRAARTGRRLRGLLRDIELLDVNMPAHQRAQRLEDILRLAKAHQSLDARQFGLTAAPAYSFFNDDRFLRDWLAWPV